MTAPTPIRILHLSDFHFRDGEDWTTKPVLSGLGREIRAMVAAGLAPDLVAVTGDIAFSGRDSEYALAGRWVREELLPIVPPLTEQDILFVAGNHDVDRSTVNKFVLEGQDTLNSRRDQDMVTEVLRDSEMPFLRRHKNFLNFVNSFRSPSALLISPWWSERRELGGIRIGLVGLNTAWMSCNDWDQGRLIVGRYQLNTVLDGMDDVDLLVCLMHHPHEDLRDFDRSEVRRLLRNRCHLVLSGHLHEQETTQVAGRRHSCLELSAGSVYGGFTWHNGFQLVEIHPHTHAVHVHHRVWSGGAWLRDHAMGTDGIAVYALDASRPPAVPPAVEPPPRPESALPVPEHERVHRTNLVNESGIVGRDAEVEWLSRVFMDEGARLVTIVGPGGSGKTRLSREVGMRLIERFPDGVWFADLTEARTSAGVAKAVGQAFGVLLTALQAPEETVANLLAYRDSLLLILDNFEQVVEFAATTVGHWLARAPKVRILVTSREVLGLSERNLILTPLSAPASDAVDLDSLEKLREYDAVQLFLARMHRPERRLSEEELRAVARICSELEGVPLAIELAAARTAASRIQEIAARLDEMINLPVSGTAVRRHPHPSMSAAIEWSFELLSPCERDTFVQIGVFRDSFPAAAVERVVDVSHHLDAPPMLAIIEALLKKSLLRSDETRFDMRFRVFLTIREFLERKLNAPAARTERAAAIVRHAVYYVEHCEELDAQLTGPGLVDALDRIGLAIENLLVAQDRMLAAGEWQLAARAILALTRSWGLRQPSVQWLSRLWRALEALPDDERDLRARLLTALSAAQFERGRADEALQLARDAVAATASRPEQARAAIILQRARMEFARNLNTAAFASAEMARRLFAEAGNPHGTCQALELKGRIRLRDGESGDARRFCMDADAEATSLADPLLQARILELRGYIEKQDGAFDRALSSFKQAEALATGISAASLLTDVLIGEAIVLNRLDRTDEALRLLSQTEREGKERGNKHQVARALGNRAHALIHMGHFQEAFAALDQTEALSRELQNDYFLGLVYCNRAIGHLQAGDAEAAEAMARTALPLVYHKGRAPTRLSFITLSVLARAAAARGKRSDAVKHAKSAQAAAVTLMLRSSDPDAEISGGLAQIGEILGGRTVVGPRNRRAKRTSAVGPDTAAAADGASPG